MLKKKKKFVRSRIGFTGARFTEVRWSRACVLASGGCMWIFGRKKCEDASTTWDGREQRVEIWQRRGARWCVVHTITGVTRDNRAWINTTTRTQQRSMESARESPWKSAGHLNENSNWVRWRAARRGQKSRRRGENSPRERSSHFFFEDSFWWWWETRDFSDILFEGGCVVSCCVDFHDHTSLSAMIQLDRSLCLLVVFSFYDSWHCRWFAVLLVRRSLFQLFQRRLRPTPFDRPHHRLRQHSSVPARRNNSADCSARKAKKKQCEERK